MQSPSGSSQQMDQLKTLNQGLLFASWNPNAMVALNVPLFLLGFIFILNNLYCLCYFFPELRGRVSELERNLANQEKEIKSQTSKLQDLQTQLNQTRKDLSERDRDLAKKSHELSQGTDKYQQVLCKVCFCG